MATKTYEQKMLDIQKEREKVILELGTELHDKYQIYSVKKLKDTFVSCNSNEVEKLEAENEKLKRNVHELKTFYNAVKEIEIDGRGYVSIPSQNVLKELKMKCNQEVK
jgi:hypothetical protein